MVVHRGSRNLVFIATAIAIAALSGMYGFEQDPVEPGYFCLKFSNASSSYSGDLVFKVVSNGECVTKYLASSGVAQRTQLNLRAWSELRDEIQRLEPWKLSANRQDSTIGGLTMCTVVWRSEVEFQVTFLPDENPTNRRFVELMMCSSIGQELQGLSRRVYPRTYWFDSYLSEFELYHNVPIVLSRFSSWVAE